jgi:endogenous inhibitor of DNA gyrase (YacG/DUF329 family)
MNPVRCPCCHLLEVWPDNSLKPYCSEVCRSLWRHVLAWRVQPYRIVVASHPHLIVQDGPSFDLRDQALKGARDRELAAERKRRQRRRANISDVTLTTQHSSSIRVPFVISGVENRQGVQSDGN